MNVLGSVQTPDNATLESCGKNLVDWYSSYLISIQEHLKRISGTVVCDAFFYFHQTIMRERIPCYKPFQK